MAYKNELAIGDTGTGKTYYLMENVKKYDDILSFGKKILVLVPNSYQLSLWKKTGLNTADIFTFDSFIRKEIFLFYPEASKILEKLKPRDMIPEILSAEAVEYLLTFVLSKKRDGLGALSILNSSSNRIAKLIYEISIKASDLGLDTTAAFDSLKLSYQNINDSSNAMFEELKALINSYKNTANELGLIDRSSFFMLYKYMVRDKNYLKILNKRYPVIAVDNLEFSNFTFVELVAAVSKITAGILCAYNPYNLRGGLQTSLHKEIEKLKAFFEIVEFDKCKTSEPKMYLFSELLSHKLRGLKTSGLALKARVERKKPYQLRSKMLEETGMFICKLVEDENYKPGEIAVISNFCDPVTEYAIKAKLAENGIGLHNVNSDHFGRTAGKAIIALYRITVLGEGSLSRDEARVLAYEFLRLGWVESSAFADIYIKNQHLPVMDNIFISQLSQEQKDYYNNLLEFIDNAREEDLAKIPERFFMKGFEELLLNKENLKYEDMQNVMELSEFSKGFFENISRFKGIRPEKALIETLEGGIRHFRNYDRLEDAEKNVLLSTPEAYLLYPHARKVVILTSVSSKNWYRKSTSELGSLNALANLEGNSEENMEELWAIERMSSIVPQIIKKCRERLVTFESILNNNGYENYGILSDFFDQLI